MPEDRFEYVYVISWKHVENKKNHMSKVLVKFQAKVKAFSWKICPREQIQIFCLHLEISTFIFEWQSKNKNDDGCFTSIQV